MTVKAVALYSGGLDSILAREAAARQGVEVVCVWMSTCFQKPYIDVVKLGKGLSRLESDLSSRFKTCVAVLSVCEEFFHIMQDPAHGFGKNVNPCIDCKIAMMKRAKSYMNKIGASFIISGEVLGQRPMSQNREALKLIEREAGVEGLVLRPLCAQHLDETVPEQKGWVDRKKLYGFRGRGRKAQMNLAEQFGITEYPQPAGGCLLTDPGFARRVEDVLEYEEKLDGYTAPLCATGRHFRISGQIKLILGRDHSENRFLESFKDNTLIIPDKVPGPSGMVIGECTHNEDKIICCRILARYITKAEGQIEFSVYNEFGEPEKIRAEELPEEEVERMRI